MTISLEDYMLLVASKIKDFEIRVFESFKREIEILKAQLENEKRNVDQAGEQNETKLKELQNENAKLTTKIKELEHESRWNNARFR